MPLQDLSLETIIRDLRRDNNRERNSQLLFYRFYCPVCRYFQGKGLSAEDSQDLAQEVFRLVFQSLHTVRDESHFVAWLYTVARNVFNNEIERRRAKKRSAARISAAAEDSDDDPLETAAAGPGSSALKRVLDKEKVRALWQEMQKLPEQMRRCVYLRVAHEQSDEGIAIVLGISSSTVRVQLHRARKSLAEKLTPVFGDLQI